MKLNDIMFLELYRGSWLQECITLGEYEDAASNEWPRAWVRTRLKLHGARDMSRTRLIVSSMRIPR